MKRLILHSALLLIFLSQSSCLDEEELIPLEEAPSVLDCNTTTERYAKALLTTTDPEEELDHTELLCWNNTHPYQISSGGTGECGEGYEDMENPYLTMRINASEFEVDDPRSRIIKRDIIIGIPFACNDYSTQEKFFNLISVGNYSFANSNKDFGRFIVEYINMDGVVIYSSLNADNSEFDVEILEVSRNKSRFNSEPNGNNGNPVSVDVKMVFNCILINDTGEVIEIRDAEVSGTFYRMAPWGDNYWEDWGEGWDQ